MSSDPNETRKINTGGGANIGGDVSAGGNVAGRDMIDKSTTIYNIHGKPSTELPATALRPLAYFVGRKKTLKEIKTIITKNSQASIVAILGMGGIGKTALAQQIAEAVKVDFTGGVFWGDELPAQDSNPNIILKQWGRLCGQNLEKESDENLPSIVRALLAQKAQSGRVLVVVDDVRLDWLGAGLNIIKEALPPGVPMIITTRQAEVALEVGAKIFNLDVLSRAESRRLLAYLSERKITSSNANKISELCGDMPLALILIAGLSQIRTAGWLIDRLQVEAKRLDILKLGRADKKEQSVKISFDISYQALAEQYPESARIFRSLAVFAQPTFIIFEHLINTLAQVEKQKLSDQNSEKEFVRTAEDEFLRLADWSLLSKEKNIAGAEMQYFQLHTLLHEYAQPLLVDAIEIDEAVKNHIRYCVDFSDANHQLDLQIHQKSTQEFEKSYGQLLQALKQIKDIYLVKGIEWKNEPELAHQVISLVEALDHHWQLHSQFANQVEWLQVAYNCAAALNDTLKQADFARRLGRVLSQQGHLDDALAWMERCKTALGEDQSAAANAIRALMYIHRASLGYQKGALGVAEKDCMRGLEMVTEKGQPAIYAEGHNILGAIKLGANKLPAAREAFEKSLSAWKQIGDPYQIHRVGDNVRTVRYYLGDVAYLRKADQESLQYWERFPDRIELASALTNRGGVHYLDGEYESAVELYQRAIEMSDRIEVQRMRVITRLSLASPYIALGKYEQAQALLDEILEIQEKSGIMEYRIDACRAEVEIGRKNYLEAIEFAEIALKSAREEQNVLEESAALRILGQAYSLNGNLKQAGVCLKKSLSLLRDSEDKYNRYLTLQTLADYYSHTGATEQAQAASAKTQGLAKEMGLPSGIITATRQP
jgi:tetratricopeptide (TPR) repeat protein